MWLVGAVARKSKSSSWRGQALIACVFGLALLLGGASWFATTSAEERERAEQSRMHAVEVLQTADAIEIAALNVIRGERGYLLTDDPEFLEPMTQAGPEGRALVDDLNALVADNTEQMASAKGVEAEFEALLARVEGIVSVHRNGGREEARDRVRDGEGRHAIEAIVADLAEIKVQENRSLE